MNMYSIDNRLCDDWIKSNPSVSIVIIVVCLVDMPPAYYKERVLELRKTVKKSNPRILKVLFPGCYVCLSESWKAASPLVGS